MEYISVPSSLGLVMTIKGKREKQVLGANVETFSFHYFVTKFLNWYIHFKVQAFFS